MGSGSYEVGLLNPRKFHKFSFAFLHIKLQIKGSSFYFFLCIIGVMCFYLLFSFLFNSRFSKLQGTCLFTSRFQVLDSNIFKFVNLVCILLPAFSKWRRLFIIVDDSSDSSLFKRLLIHKMSKHCKLFTMAKLDYYTIKNEISDSLNSLQFFDAIRILLNSRNSIFDYSEFLGLNA